MATRSRGKDTTWSTRRGPCSPISTDFPPTFTSSVHPLRSRSGRRQRRWRLCPVPSRRPFRTRAVHCRTRSACRHPRLSCPFFIRNTPARVTGRGEHIALSICAWPAGVWLLNPGVHIPPPPPSDGSPPTRTGPTRCDGRLRPEIGWPSPQLHRTGRRTAPGHRDPADLKEAGATRRQVGADLRFSSSASPPPRPSRPGCLRLAELDGAVPRLIRWNPGSDRHLGPAIQDNAEQAEQDVGRPGGDRRWNAGMDRRHGGQLGTEDVHEANDHAMRR